MVVSHFLKWVNTAKVAERSAAAAALARAYVDRDLPFEDRCAAEAALTLLLDDPSSKVRLALADTLSMSHARAGPDRQRAGLRPAGSGGDRAVALAAFHRSRPDRPCRRRASRRSRKSSRRGRTSRWRWRRRSPRSAKPTPAPRCSPIRRPTIASLSFRRIAERHGHVATRSRGDDCRSAAAGPIAGICCWSRLGEALKSSRAGRRADRRRRAPSGSRATPAPRPA